ncbi:MAG TPA: hypothetical protein VIX59_08735 [Candidatus Binataceae bacterium]
MQAFSRVAALALVTAVVELAAGCGPSANQRIAAMNGRNQALCQADNPQACIRFLESKCDAALSACATVKQDQTGLASDLHAKCAGGDKTTCQVLASVECDRGDTKSCLIVDSLYNRLHASCKAGAQSDCQLLAAEPWPNRIIATTEKTCKAGDQISCGVDNAAHAENSGVVVTVPADYKP